MRKKNFLAVVLMNALVACGGGGGDGGSTEALPGKQTTYSIGGTLRLAEAAPDQTIEVRLVDRLGGRSLTLRASGSFTFDSVASGTSYEIHVPSNPAGFSCEVHNGNGRVDAAPKSDIEVVCTAGAYSVRGVTTGLGSVNPGLQIANGTQTLGVNGDGPFSFSVRNGGSYRIHVTAAHSHYVCELRNSSGVVATEISGTINAADVDGISLTCAAPIGVRISGLPPVTPSLHLTNTYSVPGQPDAVDNLYVDREGEFSFGTNLPSGRTYRVNVAVQHPDHDCTAPTTRMTVGVTPVLVNVTCEERVYAIGGSVNGLTATGLELRLTSGPRPSETISVPPPGSSSSQQFTFNTRIPSGAQYEIGVINEPAALVCDFAPQGSGAGQVNRATVNVTLQCSLPEILTVSSVESGGASLANGASNFPLSGSATILFSAALNAATVNGSSISLAGPYGTHAANLEVNSNSVTIRPVGKLVPLTTYTLAVETTIRGTRKQSIATRFVRSFTTGSGWGTASIVGTPPSGTVLSLQPQHISMDPAGNALSIWSWRSFSLVPYPNSAAVYRYSAASRTWNPRDQLLQNLYTGQVDGFSYQIGMDATGNATTIWSEYDGTSTFDLVSNRYSSASGSWTSSQPVESLTAHAVNPQLRVSGNGDAVAIWHQGNQATRALYAIQYRAATGLWSEPTQLSNSVTPGIGDAQTLAIDRSGNAIAIWIQAEGSSRTVFASRYNTSTRSWDLPQPIDSTLGPVGLPNLVMDESGNALVVWSKAVGTTVSINSRSFNGSSLSWNPVVSVEGFSASNGGYSQVQHRTNANGELLIAFRLMDQSFATVVYTGSGTVAQGLQPVRYICSVCSVSDLAIDNDGNQFVITSESDYQTSWLMVRRGRLGEAWQPATRLDTAGPRNAAGAQLATDASGNTIAVWLQQDHNNVMRAFGNYFSILTNAWGTPQSIEDNQNAISGVKVVIDSQGNATAIWSDQTSLYSNRFE